ncbi:unnamed protein product [Sphagnum jensenii]|uniref:Uncharacterized protein n=1 Tax=Sphagnum jensenii TaxID=128206 RepID=A0ABP0X6H5_9BRYO
MPWRETEEKKEEEEEENVGSPGGKLEISEARSRLRIYEYAVPGKRVQKWEEEEEAKEWRMDQSRAKVFFRLDRLSSLLEFVSLRSVTKADRCQHLKSQPVGDDRGKDNQLSTHHQT